MSKLDEFKAAIEKKNKKRSSARVYLNIPFDQKDIAKQAGCQWDFANKAWFFTGPTAEELEMFKEFDWLFKETSLSKTRDEYMKKVADNKKKYSYQYEYKFEEKQNDLE